MFLIHPFSREEVVSRFIVWVKITGPLLSAEGVHSLSALNQPMNVIVDRVTYFGIFKLQMATYEVMHID